MVTALQLYENLKNDSLMHYGTPGMHWRQQGPGKRYQSQAVYAQGRPNPDAKVIGAFEKKSWLPGSLNRRRPSSSDRLQSDIDKKSTAELKEATARLNAEKEYKNALVNNMKATQDYNNLLNSGNEKIKKKFMNALKWVSKSDAAKFGWNYTKYQIYKTMSEKHGEDMAKTIFKSAGLLKFDDGGGKKDKDKKDQQKDQNGGK